MSRPSKHSNLNIAKSRTKNLPGFTSMPLGKNLILPPIPITKSYKLQPLKKDHREPEKLPEHFIKGPIRIERELISKQNRLRYKTASLALHRVNMLDAVDEVDEEWEQLKEKEEMLRSTFIEFQRFLRMNLYKRERFKEEHHQHMVMIRKKSIEIQVLMKDVEEMRKVRLLMRHKIKKYEDKYLHFLLSTVRQSNKYQEIHEMMNTYETLVKAKDSICSMEMESVRTFVEYKDRFLKMAFEKQLQIEKKELMIDRLLPAFIEAKSRAHQAEVTIRNVVEEITKFEVEAERTLGAIYTMYMFICRRNCAVPLFGKGDYVAHLPFIKWVLGNVEKVKRKLGLDHKEKVVRWKKD
ncbi:cilia- and flagella-associated protein 73-like [Harmonia axyridis]|uniref:cilia- and flagella-associated protein 73-like n=1 Tax=Harmonia axyridis TaxID=115357 RepID=UPI001E2774F1|nr:cilia- and flagella-associated protein 73-like [Harmonia axyridis]